MGPNTGFFDEKGQGVTDAVNIIDAQNDDYVESIDILYNGDDKDDPDKDKMRQAVLSGMVPISILDAGASPHCGQPTKSTCRKYKLNADPFIPT